MAGLLHAVLYVFAIAPSSMPSDIDAETRTSTEHGLQLAPLRVDHRERESPQQSSRSSPFGQVQRPSLGIRFLVAHHPRARAMRLLVVLGPPVASVAVPTVHATGFRSGS